MTNDQHNELMTAISEKNEALNELLGTLDTLETTVRDIAARLERMEPKLNALVPGTKRTRSTLDALPAATTVTEARRAEFLRVFAMTGNLMRSAKLQQGFHPAIVPRHMADLNGETWHIVARSVALNRIALRSAFRPRTDIGEVSAFRCAEETLASLVRDKILIVTSIRALTDERSDTVVIADPAKLPLTMRQRLGLASWDEVKGTPGKRAGDPLAAQETASAGNGDDEDEENEENAGPVGPWVPSTVKRVVNPEDTDDDDTDEPFVKCFGDEEAGTVEIEESAPKKAKSWGERINESR